MQHIYYFFIQIGLRGKWNFKFSKDIHFELISIICLLLLCVILYIFRFCFFLFNASIAATMESKSFKIYICCFFVKHWYLWVSISVRIIAQVGPRVVLKTVPCKLAHKNLNIRKGTITNIFIFISHDIIFIEKLVMFDDRMLYLSFLYYIGLVFAHQLR